MYPTWTAIPDGDVEPCSYCGSEFRESAQLTLHKGLEHSGRLSVREQAEYERVERDEQQALRLYRLQATGALIILYFFLLIAFALFA